MNYTFEPAPLEAVDALYQTYMDTFSGEVDNFWEDQVLRAQQYTICREGEPCGLFAVAEWEGAPTLSAFYLTQPCWGDAQAVFRQARQAHHIRRALVATCDELFLSLSLDVHERVNLQAYFFDGTIPPQVRPPEYPRACLSPVALADLPRMRERTGDFFDFCTDEDYRQGKFLLYQLADQGEVLGYGIMEFHRLRRDNCSLGMITLPEHRRKGVGRSIQYHQGEICREMGKRPVSGCWYGNPLSRDTQHSAGRYSKTRYLNILLHEPDWEPRP